MLRPALSLVVLLSLPGVARAGCATGPLVINELMPDPTGTDTDAEWVELFNPTGAAISLAGWRIERAKSGPSDWATLFEAPVTAEIQPGSYYVLAGPIVVFPGGVDGANVAWQGAGLGNAGTTNSDGVRLVDCDGLVVDVVAYGGANTAGQVYADESGVDILDARLAPRPVSGVALARLPDGTDTDDGAADFVAQAPTLGVSNGGGIVTPGDCEAGVRGDIVLNELVPDPAGTDTDAEWVELFHAGTSPVDVSGWVIERAKGGPTDWADLFVLPADTVMQPGEFLVVGGPLADLPGGIDTVLVDWLGAGMGNAGASNSDAVRLTDCDGTVLDVVVYGGLNTVEQVYLDEDGTPVLDGSLAPQPASGQALARLPDGRDTGDNAADFGRQLPTPGASNGSTPVSGDCVEGTAGEVVINEFFANPVGTDGGLEWVELYHPGEASVDLAGWTIQQAGAPEDWGSRIKFTFPAGAVVEPGQHVLVAEELVASPETGVIFVMGEGARLSLGNSQDGLRLADCAGTPIDTVVYGGSNPDGFADDEGVVYTDAQIGPLVAEEASIARRADGYDSDDSGADLVLEPDPTPGAPNRDLTCKGTRGEVFINELMPNPAGVDSEARSEFVELYNAGDDPVDVSTWTLTKITSLGEDGPNETLLHAIAPGTVLAPGAFLVVGGVFAEEADQFSDPFDLGSGTDGDLVALYDCTGARADGVLYGGPNEDRLEEDSGAIPDNGAPDPSDDQCVARKGDGFDTNTSSEDFVTTAFCTPGATNERGRTPVPDVEGPAGGCDCGGGVDGEPVVVDPTVVEPATPGSCTVSGAPRATAVLWLAAMALVRRRRGSLHS